MDVQAYDSLSGFWSEVAHVYEADPVRHTIAITVLHGMLAQENHQLAGDTESPLLLRISEDGATIGAAFCTPPWPLGVSAVPPHAVDVVVDFLRARDIRPSGVTGPREPADGFAAAWEPGAELVVDLRCYRLATLSAPDRRGEPRLAGFEDVDLLAEWERAFFKDAGLLDHPGDHREQLVKSLALGNAHVLWCVDGEVRAAARASVPRRGMSRVGIVYTPPEHRRQGYGAAVTAAASQWALDNGAQDVVLFTDLANPTSNAIYQHIGYRPVYDAVEYRFRD